MERWPVARLPVKPPVTEVAGPGWVTGAASSCPELAWRWLSGDPAVGVALVCAGDSALRTPWPVCSPAGGTRPSWGCWPLFSGDRFSLQLLVPLEAEQPVGSEAAAAALLLSRAEFEGRSLTTSCLGGSSRGGGSRVRAGRRASAVAGGTGLVLVAPLGLCADQSVLASIPPKPPPVRIVSLSRALQGPRPPLSSPCPWCVRDDGCHSHLPFRFT